MKEMQYGHLNGAITLDHDKYKEYEYIIVNLGSHPMCYVQIPKGHPYYEKDFWNMSIKPHSDLSFGGTLEKYHLEGFWIGWEYNLFGDYVYGRSREYVPEGWHKQYTIEDLVLKTYEVIDQLIDIQTQKAEVKEDFNE